MICPESEGCCAADPRETHTKTTVTGMGEGGEERSGEDVLATPGCLLGSQDGENRSCSTPARGERLPRPNFGRKAAAAADRQGTGQQAAESASRSHRCLQGEPGGKSRPESRGCHNTAAVCHLAAEPQKVGRGKWRQHLPPRPRRVGRFTWTAESRARARNASTEDHAQKLPASWQRPRVPL